MTKEKAPAPELQKPAVETSIVKPLKKRSPGTPAMAKAFSKRYTESVASAEEAAELFSKRRVSHANPEEVIALRLIVGILLARLAVEHWSQTDEPAQTWINNFAAICHDSLAHSTFNSTDRRDMEMRARVADQINQIVGTALFEDDKTSKN